ncbi:predicted protein [Postia placenta Mad-698-R]|nr:predicted protein [Postia placenta Mad-698-R]
MSLSTQQRTDIKRIIEALGRQAIELQQQRGMLIRLIQADPSYVVSGAIRHRCGAHLTHSQDDVFRISRGVRYLIEADPVAGRFQYTESVNQLIVKVQRIEASLARIKEKTTELHLLIPPIECLPAELLVLIFQAGSLSEPKGLHPFPMIVSAVSRRWRAVAMSTPTLWTNLYITPCLMLLNVATCPLSWDFVAAFSTITQLIVINSGANQFLEILRPKWLQSATGVMHGALVWPRLRDVTMLDQTNYDDLYGMVAERTAHGSPLRRLIVHTEFVHRNMLTPLLQYVKVDSVTYLDRDL